MKQRILYRCDHCEFKSFDEDAVKEHEANCLLNLNSRTCMTCRFPWGSRCEEVVPAVDVTLNFMKTVGPCPHWVLSKHVESDENKLWELRDYID